MSMFRTLTKVLALVFLAGAGTQSAIAQDIESLFGATPRDLTHLVSASSTTRLTLRRASSAEGRGDWPEAARLIDELLRDIARQGASAHSPVVAVPTGSMAGARASGCFRRADEVAMARVMSWSESGRRSYEELAGASARVLEKLWRDGNDPAVRRELAMAYTLRPEGARALLELADEALEAGRPGEALARLDRWLRFARGHETDSAAGADEDPGGVQAVLARRAIVLELLGLAPLVAGERPGTSDARTVEYGGVAGDVPEASLPPRLAAALEAARRGDAPGVEIPLGAPLFSSEIEALVNRRYLAPSSAFSIDHPLHTALPLLEPARVDDLVVFSTPLSLQVLDLDLMGERVSILAPESDSALTALPDGDPRWLRIGGSRGAGLREALSSSVDSYLVRFPLPRIEEQWVRLAPVLDVERDSAGRANLVAYVVLGEDSVARGYMYGSVLVKVLLASAATPRERLSPLSMQTPLWAANLESYIPSGRPLLRARQGRVAIGCFREPTGNESALEIAIADLRADSGDLVSLTAISNPPTNRAWQQDREVISLAHPVSLALAPDGSVIVADQRGSIASVDLLDLRDGDAPGDAPPEPDEARGTMRVVIDSTGIPRITRSRPRTHLRAAATPNAAMRWAITYRSLHLDGDAYDSGLRGWAASAPAFADSGALAVAPSDSDELFVIGSMERADAAVDLELPVTRAPRENRRFMIGASGDAVTLVGEVAAALDTVTGAGWRGAPRDPDGVVLRRAAQAGGMVFDPARDAVRILDAASGRIVGVLTLPAPLAGGADMRWLEDAERLGVSVLGDLLVLFHERGIAAWRLD